MQKLKKKTGNCLILAKKVLLPHIDKLCLSWIMTKNLKLKVSSPRAGNPVAQSLVSADYAGLHRGKQTYRIKILELQNIILNNFISYKSC